MSLIGINDDDWRRTAVKQPADKNLCYAATLTSVTRFLCNQSEITISHFVRFFFGDEDSIQMPSYELYMEKLSWMVDFGVEYSAGSGRRKLKYKADVQNFLEDANKRNPGFCKLIKEQLSLKSAVPPICTVENGAHDVVIIRAEVENGEIRRIWYWNPADDGIGTFAFDAFVAEMHPLLVTAVWLDPPLEMIAFVSAKEEEMKSASSR